MVYKRTRRSGAALVVALVTLAIAGALSMSMIRTAVLRREQLQSAQRRVQADWLVKSGIQRAAASLAADQQYRGETWEPSLEDFASGSHASVTIQVQDSQDRPALRRIAVVARCELAGKVAQRSRHAVVSLAKVESPQ
jgi:type II secretory pathway component PulK